MEHYRRSEILLAAHLSAVAGFVDAVGFMYLGGFFLSFMSGNTTRMTSAVARNDWTTVATAAGVMGTFMVGVVLGAVVFRLSGLYCRVWVLGTTSLFMLCSAILAATGVERVAMMVLGLAIGAMNSTFERGGEVSIGLTYMTGTLVKAGHRFADVFFGGSHAQWLFYASLWLGLAVGSLAGAVTFAVIGLTALWISTALVLSATAATWWVRYRRISAGLPVSVPHTYRPATETTR